jgi:RNA polymerase sigma-70 factor (ECF subfamily)
MKPDEFLPTRHSLLQRLKNWEDQASWQDFFDTYAKLIYGVALKAGLTDAEAQDVVQETVMTVAKNIKDFQVGSEHGSFKGWLLKITRWRIADQFRKRPEAAPLTAHGSGDTIRTSTTDRIADPASLNLDAVWDADWEQNLLDAAMEKVQQQVEPAQFQMFHLHVMRQWTAEKVAQKLGVKIGKVYFAKYKISRLIKKEAKRLEAEWF